jgi:hypothetical protein
LTYFPLVYRRSKTHSEYYGHSSTKWYHCDCVEVDLFARIDDAAKIAGYKSLKPADKKKLTALVKGGAGKKKEIDKVVVFILFPSFHSIYFYSI